MEADGPLIDGKEIAASTSGLSNMMTNAMNTYTVQYLTNKLYKESFLDVKGRVINEWKEARLSQ
eukprot:868425-Amphidinium_carterae.1